MKWYKNKIKWANKQNMKSKICWQQQKTTKV